MLTVLNIFGIWRWLGRQAKVEEGGARRREASEQTPGEALFPVSLLTRAPVDAGGRRSRHTASTPWPAAAAAGSHYVVVSEGGVAGVGETLRRLPGAQAQVDGETARRPHRCGPNSRRFEELAKDQWPGALIVTAELGAADFAWLDGLRRAPLSGRAQPRAGASDHVPCACRRRSKREAAARACAGLADEPPPQATIAGLMDLGGGVAFRVVSDDLDAHPRRACRSVFTACSARRTSGGWRPHVTIQNKVPPKRRARCSRRWSASFTPRPLAICGLRPAPLSRRSVGDARESIRSAALAEVADPVAAEVERGEAGFEHRGEHRHVHQLVDRAVACRRSTRSCASSIASSQSAAS